MSDPISMAKTAREGLSQALAALQTDPSVPPALLAVAEPVSQAMGALFFIERSGGAALAEQGPRALEAVRQALAMLQAQPLSHVAVSRAMEAVAGSLGLLHGLSKVAQQAPPVAAQPAPPVQAPPLVQPPQAAQPPWPAQVAHAPRAPQVIPPPWSPQAPQAAQAPWSPQAAPPPQAIQAGQPAPPAQEAPRPAASSLPSQTPSGWAPPEAMSPIEVSLAAHSPSNFYRGLAGDDVVDHGGIFVATYQSLPVGRAVVLRILFPGGYEAEAFGTVRFTRAGSGSSGDMSHPGYGVAFTRISNEGRILVSRYVRNREPIFYDDF